ncbi:MAG: hypothetical protein KAI79_05785 [Bacteroidales bacterium]|nr:hypothetical protein [Bacteroidales bacterium]
MLNSCIKKENQSQLPNIVFVFVDVQSVIRDKQYKIIKYSVDGEKHAQLFDLFNYPFETINLSDRQGYEQIIKNLDIK